MIPLPFHRKRMVGLREAKRLRQDELTGVAHAAVRQYETGHKTPGPEALESLADALDCTMDYLSGRGVEYGGYERAAAQMSFAIFERDISVSTEQRDRCRRVLGHEEAPRTVKAWKDFAEMVDLAIGPPPPRIGIAKSG